MADDLRLSCLDLMVSMGDFKTLIGRESSFISMARVISVIFLSLFFTALDFTALFRIP